MRRTITAVAALALGAAILTGCGSKTSESAYCKEMKGTDVASLSAAGERTHKLADLAPSEIKGDWKTLVDATESAKNFDMKNMSDVQAQVNSMSKKAADVNAAGKKITEYNKNNCTT